MVATQPRSLGGFFYCGTYVTLTRPLTREGRVVRYTRQVFDSQYKIFIHSQRTQPQPQPPTPPPIHPPGTLPTKNAQWHPHIIMPSRLIFGRGRSRALKPRTRRLADVVVYDPEERILEGTR